MPRIPTADLLDTLLDAESWRSWDAPVVDPPGSPQYRAELTQARAETGTDESVTTGSGRVSGVAVAVVAGNFDFLAGSVGAAAADRIVAAFDRATALGLPVLGLPTSGGTRMQEGTPAFLRMAGIAGAVRAHATAGLPYLVYLRHPTTGGVFATWGSLGDVTFAQPDSLTGFLGPRVYEGLYGESFPGGVQSGEGLTEAGVIDGVATPSQWRDIVARVLAVWRGRPDAGVAPPGWESPSPDVTHPPSNKAPERDPAGLEATAWEVIERTRDPARTGAAALIDDLPGAVELSGTLAGERAAATRLWLVTFDGTGCVVIAQDRARQEQCRARGAALGITAADLRVARRGMMLAERWALPLVTIVDTQGAELSPAAERGALAGEIARCLADLMHLRTATVSVLLGGGGGGGALALLPADRTLAASDAWVTPLPVEGASLISHRTPDRAAEIAEQQHIRATDLAHAGAVDRIVVAPTDDVGAWREVLAEEVSRAAAAGAGPLPRRWPGG